MVQVETKSNCEAEAGIHLPNAEVQLESKGLKVEVEKIVNNMLRDQQRKMVAGDGCISNPGGPGC